MIPGHQTAQTRGIFEDIIAAKLAPYIQKIEIAALFEVGMQLAMIALLLYIAVKVYEQMTLK